MVHSIALLIRTIAFAGGTLFLLSGIAEASEPPGPQGPTALLSPLTAAAFSEAVLSHNASLEAMRQATVAAIAKTKSAGALDDATLSVSVAPRTIGASTGTSGDIEVSQPLPWWGTLDTRRQVADAEAEAADRDVAALGLRLAALARGAFSDWVYVHRALGINSTNLALLDALRSSARIRYSNAQAPQEDVLQADVQRAMLKQQRLEWESRLTTVRARMNALLDRPPQSAIPDPAELPEPVRLPAEEFLAERAAAHPQLGRLAAEERAAAAKERLAGKERYPKFGVRAGYNNMWSDPEMRPMVGLSITIPLDQEKYRAAIDAARAEARRAASSLEDERASLLADLASAYASTREAEQSLALYRDELVPLARNTLEVARSEYGTGRGDFLNVLTAEQRRLETELGLARMQSDYYQRLAELDRLSGGGLLSTPGLAAADTIPQTRRSSGAATQGAYP